MISRGKTLSVLLLAAGLIAVVGCRKSNPFTEARITGKVTYAGAPVTGGTIIFHLADGTQMPANIGTDGSYGMELPVGEVAVTIETESLNPNKKMPSYDDRTAGSGAGMAKLYGKAPAGGGGSGKNKAGYSTPEGATGSGGSYVKIPAKYADKSKSGLTVSLVKGNQTKDFDLTD